MPHLSLTPIHSGDKSGRGLLGARLRPGPENRCGIPACSLSLLPRALPAAQAARQPPSPKFPAGKVGSLLGRPAREDQAWLTLGWTWLTAPVHPIMATMCVVTGKWTCRKCRPPLQPPIHSHLLPALGGGQASTSIPTAPDRPASRPPARPPAPAPPHSLHLLLLPFSLGSVLLGLLGFLLLGKAQGLGREEILEAFQAPIFFLCKSQEARGYSPAPPAPKARPSHGHCSPGPVQWDSAQEGPLLETLCLPQLEPQPLAPTEGWC